MACCAIAAFIFSQFYLGGMALRRWLGLRAGDDGRRSTDASWRADAPAAAPVRPGWRRWFDFSARRAVVAALLSVGSVGVVHAVADASPTSAAGLLSGLLHTLCSSR